MKNGSIKAILFIASLISTSLVSSSYAQEVPTIPTFPACKAPQGEMIVNYPTGTHGIAGDSASYTGSDKVFQLSDSTLSQCFCSTNGNGIQTNWWKISSLKMDQVEILKKLGWVYVPNGAEWGLQEAPYMAQSTEYSCINKRHDDHHDSHDDPKKEKHIGGITGEVLGASTYIGNVLGLASTGSATKFVVYIGLAFVSFCIIAIYLVKSDKNDKTK